MAVLKGKQVHLLQDFSCLLFILGSHTEQNFIQNTFSKELVVYILHNHIAEFQSFFSGIVLALILHRSLEVLFQPAEAPSKGGFSRTIMSDDSRGAAGWERGFRYMQGFRLMLIGEGHILYRPNRLVHSLRRAFNL